MKSAQITNPYPIPVARTGCQPDKTLLGLVKSIENRGAVWPWFAKVYAGLFYKKMVEREITLSVIAPGMSVLHVGCGPFPMTAIYLAQFGARVTAMDSDPAALALAEKPLSRAALGEQVQLVAGCGTRVDYSGFNAIWFSLHVRPLDRVLRYALETSDPHTALICRVPRGNLARLYREVDKNSFAGNAKWKEIRQPFGKKSILVKKA